MQRAGLCLYSSPLHSRTGWVIVRNGSLETPVSGSGSPEPHGLRSGLRCWRAHDITRQKECQALLRISESPQTPAINDSAVTIDGYRWLGYGRRRCPTSASGPVMGDQVDLFSVDKNKRRGRAAAGIIHRPDPLDHRSLERHRPDALVAESSSRPDK